MDTELLGIINEKSKQYYARLTPPKARAFRSIVYAGIRMTIDGVNLVTTADELGCTPSTVSKYIHKWNELQSGGDVLIHKIVAAYNSFKKKRLRVPKSVKTDIPADTETDKELSDINPTGIARQIKEEKPKGSWVLGFFITPEDELRERAAKRSAILYMEELCKGPKPRMLSDYYYSDKPQQDENDTKSQWLPLTAAALYCGCSERVIESEGKVGGIARRAYKHGKNHTYYEYRVTDLNKFIKDKGLI